MTKEKKERSKITVGRLGQTTKVIPNMYCCRGFFSFLFNNILE